MHSDTHKGISLKLGLMIDTTELFIYINKNLSERPLSRFKATGMQESKDLSASNLSRFSTVLMKFGLQLRVGGLRNFILMFYLG